MATRVTISTLDDGQVVVDKVQLTGDEHDRRAEARWLAEARTRGVVRLLSISEEPFTIRTAHAGAATLRTARPDPGQAAAVLTDAATTLADLHERGLVHGAISLDHVVVDGTRSVLCSPTGGAREPSDDVGGLGQCMIALIERWADEGVRVPHGPEWEALAARLSDPSPSLSARRAARALARLAAEPVEHRAPPTRRRLVDSVPEGRGVGIGAVAAVVTLAIVGLFVVPDSGPTSGIASTGPTIDIGIDRFAVGSEGDLALVLPDGCGAAAALLDGSSDTVWVFDRAADGQEARAVARVPGATSIEVGGNDRCAVVATGPAGATTIDY